MPKNKNLPKIPELTRSGYRAFFENFDDSWVFEPTYPLKKNEPKIVEALRLKFGEDAQIFAVREVSEPNGVSMPDLIFNGEKTEIKTISGKRSIERQVRKAYIQKSSAIVFDISNLSITDAEMLKKVEFETSRRGISHFGFFDGEKIVYKNEKKENSLTELYPKQDQTASGFIISQNGKKVKIASINPGELGIKIHNSIKLNSPHTHGYWQNRAIANFERNEADTSAYSRRIARIYADSERKIIAEIKKLYANYYRSDNTFDLQALNSIEPAGNVAKFKAEMKRLGLETHLPDNYAFRMTRLEMLQNQLWAEIKGAGFKHTDAQTASATSTIKNSYGRAIADAERKFGSIGAFAKLDNQTLARILNSKIEGTHFSSRIWKNTDVLAEHINSKLASAIAIGQSPEKTIREIRERFDVGRFYAERLVRTESAFYHNLAQLQAYRQMGAEKYQLIATLDGRTSQICQHKHHRIFAVKDAKVGENFPPFHPMCRTATMAYFGEVAPEKDIALPEPIKIEPASEGDIVPVKISPKSADSIPYIKASPNLAKHLTPDRIKQTEHILNNMPKANKKVWLKFADELNYRSVSGEKQFYAYNTVNVNTDKAFASTNLKKKFETLLHEYGHGLDNRATRGTARSLSESEILPNGKTLGETVSDEAIARLNKHQGRTIAHRRGSLKNEILSELNNGYTKADMSSIFDLYGGAIYNKSMIFGIGHARRYWDGPKTIFGSKVPKEQIHNHQKKFLGLEAFAEMFSATSRRDKKQIAMYQKYLPESFEMFKELLERMSKL